MRSRPTARVLLRVTATASAALVATTSASVAAHAAPTISCGAYLTADATLTRDLACAGNGLTLAPGVRLDLGGHRLSGNGSGVAVSGTNETSGISVVHGKISNWGTGVSFVGSVATASSTLTLRKVAMSRAPLSVEAALVTIDRSRLSSSPIVIQGSTLTVRRSRLKKSSTTGELNSTVIDRSTVLGGGLALDENNGIRIVDSVLDGTGYDGYPNYCDRTRTIINSTIRGYSKPWYASDCPTYIDHSLFADNPNGVLGVDGPVTITNSRFRRNGPALVATVGGDLTVTDSTFTRNATALRLSDDAVARVYASTFARNTGSGIYAETNAPSLTLGENLARDNGEYGIYTPRAVDLGGNRAYGNGAGQCVGVAC